MARLELKKCPFCGAKVDTVSVKEKDGNLNIKIKRKDRWIPVEDALPDEFIYVICGGKDGMAILRYNGDLFVDDVGCAYSMSAITHWMPLPEPSKE